MRGRVTTPNADPAMVRQKNGPLGQAIAYQSKQELVYTALRDAILSCALLPGERLTIRDVAAQLGVSETPVRIALSRLASDRLVDEKAYGSVVVSGIAMEEARDIHPILGALQGLAAETAALRRSDEDLSRLNAILENLEHLSDQASYEAYSILNRQFHVAIAETSGLVSLPETTDAMIVRFELGKSLYGRGARGRHNLWATASHRSLARTEHRRILWAIERRLPEEARLAVVEHYRRSGADLMAHLERLHQSPLQAKPAAQTETVS